MATKKELVEAHSFSRRRLVTAFVSGAPGGREVEPARPGRTIVGGLALAVLMIAGAAIAGVFAGRVPDDWTDPGLIISEQTGAAYVITKESSQPVLRPVINITSAKLILGADITPEVVPQDAIDTQTIGDDIGILGAPASLPSPSLLIDTGWTACTGTDQGIRLDVVTEPTVDAVEGGGFVVVSGRDYYVVAQSRDDGEEKPRAHRYLLPGDPGARDDMLTELGLPVGVDATRVSEEWLALFPTGGDLGWETFGISGEGTRPAYLDDGSGLPNDSRIGDIVDVGSGAEVLVLTDEGPAPLDPFALAVYRNLPAAHQPEVRTTTESPNLARAGRPYDGARWPDSLLEPVPGEQCAQLLPEAGQVPGVRLAADPAGDASAAEVAEGRTSVRVQPGRGAYVLSGDWYDTTEGSPYVVDAKGLAYPLVGAGTADLLGYAGVDAPVVPDSWIELFEPGVNLSQDAALCPPDRAVGRTCG